jgi:dodecin
MSVAKVIEVKARSDESFEAAVSEGIRKAGESVQQMQAAWVQDQQVLLTDGAITGYQVTLKITFTVS